LLLEVALERSTCVLRMLLPNTRGHLVRAETVLLRVRRLLLRCADRRGGLLLAVQLCVVPPRLRQHSSC